MKTRSCWAVVALASFLEIYGFWLTAKGVVRESFVELSQETGGFSRQAFGRDAFDRQSFGFDEKPLVDEFLVSSGLTLGLLPTERELTTAHRKENARSAVFGVLLVLVGMSTNKVIKAWRVRQRVASDIRNVCLSALDRIRVAGRGIEAVWRRLLSIRESGAPDK